MFKSNPTITITIDSGAPPEPAFDELGEVLECDDRDYESELKDYSRPNPLRALKALFGGK